MNRKETTEFLGRLLISDRLNRRGKYWSSEVTLDYGTKNVKRVDFMEFAPAGQINVSDIEKGIFICYEVKSCKADFKSGFGQNFVGEKNYLVMPMSVYKEIAYDVPHDVGVMVPVPMLAEKYEEFESPTTLVGEISDWKLSIIKSAIPKGRKKPMNELLFCMLRSGH